MSEDDNVTILRPDGKPVKPDSRKSQLLLYRKMIDMCNYFATEGGLNPIEILGVITHVQQDIHGHSVRMQQAMAANMQQGDDEPPPSPIAQ